MDFLISVTGNSARLVRDAISQRLFPAAGHPTVPSQHLHAGTIHEGDIIPPDTG